MVREIVAAFRLLTRLPLPGPADSVPPHRAAAWFPLVGMVVGGIAALAYTGGALLWPPAVAAWAVILAEVLVTGALHLDGLADVADGMGGATPARRLEIMRDSRLGSFGALALILALSGRWVLLVTLASAAPVALLVSHTVARWAAVWTLSRYATARQGLGAHFAGVGGRELTVATVTALVVAAAGLGFRGVLAAVAAAAVGMAAAAGAARRLGGITGDVCGATAELGLLAALAVTAMQI